MLLAPALKVIDFKIRAFIMSRNWTRYIKDSLRKIRFMWGCSSVGRAVRSQRTGRRFDPDHLHHNKINMLKACQRWQAFFVFRHLYVQKCTATFCLSLQIGKVKRITLKKACTEVIPRFLKTRPYLDHVRRYALKFLSAVLRGNCF